jgi:hypothetical protein
MQTVRPLPFRTTPFVFAALLGGAIAAGCSADARDERTSASSAPVLASQIDVPFGNVTAALDTLFDGSRIQLTNTSAGTPLPDGSMSYFQAGGALKAQGVQDKALEIKEHEEQLSAKVVAGQFFGIGGVLLVDKIKFDLNDLNADFQNDTFNVTTGSDGLKLTLFMKSPQPTIKCYGNAWIPVLFLPIGWQDSACPDTNITNVSVTATFMPNVNQSSQIALSLVSVVFDSTMDGGALGQGFEYFRDYQGELKASFESNFGAFLSTPGFTSGIASALMKLVDAQAGEHVPGYAKVTVDAAGLHAFPGNVCVPKSCSGLGAQCGIVDAGCGVAIDCGGCPSGLACGAGGAARNQCGACAPPSCAAACGTVTNACGESAYCGGCPSGQTCSRNRCSACQPQCSGKRCGAPDSCGGTCAGYCGSKLQCQVDPDTGVHLCQAP